MRVTRLGLKGIVFYMMLVCAFFAAPYLNLFFMLLSFCSALALLSVWWAYRNVAGIHGEIEELAPVPAGASQLATATLQCHRRTRHGLRLEIDVDGQWYELHGGCELPPGKPKKVSIELPALPRGLHEVRGVRIRSRHPVGLVEAQHRIEAPARLAVHPAPADLARFRDRGAGAGLGLGGAHTTEMGPSGLREFRTGDELRHVHWKASARRTELVIKELEGDAAPGVEVLLDLRTAGERLEEALSLTVALALECQVNKELFTLHTQDHRGTYGKGHGSLDKLLEYLAGVQPLPADGSPPPAVSPTVLRLPLAKAHARITQEAPC